LKLHADAPTLSNTVTAYGPGFIEINKTRYSTALRLAPDAVDALDLSGFDALQPEHFAALLAARPQVVLLGTGARQRFPRPQLTRALTTAQIGVEAMTTAAACRTYNILMAEDRRVLALLLLDS
jgi:uncharacterized protein